MTSLLGLSVFIISFNTIAAQTTTTISPDLDGYLCPPKFELVREGQCRGPAQLGLTIAAKMGLNKTIELCNALNASPVIIRDEKDEAYWLSKYTSHFIIIGITCNVTTKMWQWTDGSKIDYNPPTFNGPLDKECSPDGTWMLYNAPSQYWFYFDNTRSESQTYDVYCTTNLNYPLVHTDEDCVNLDEQQSDSTCYLISEAAETYSDGQTICKSSGATLASVLSVQENNYLRRMAVSRGLVNGLLLGATVSGKSNDFAWLDGSDWNYTNFLPGFPIDSFGNCLVMDTNDINGKWANVDCSTKFPFACSRKPNGGEECQGANVKEGDVISSPGFPTNASIPCDLFLIASMGKLVEMEILLLEANSCCDHLLLYEGEFGGSLIANLTGAMTGGTYRTTKSNVMRASWQPNGGVNVRGMMITYRGV